MENVMCSELLMDQILSRMTFQTRLTMGRLNRQWWLKVSRFIHPEENLAVKKSGRFLTETRAEGLHYEATWDVFMWVSPVGRASSHLHSSPTSHMLKSGSALDVLRTFGMLSSYRHGIQRVRLEAAHISHDLLSSIIDHIPYLGTQMNNPIRDFTLKVENGLEVAIVRSISVKLGSHLRRVDISASHVSSEEFMPIFASSRILAHVKVGDLMSEGYVELCPLVGNENPLPLESIRMNGRFYASDRHCARLGRIVSHYLSKFAFGRELCHVVLSSITLTTKCLVSLFRHCPNLQTVKAEFHIHEEDEMKDLLEDLSHLPVRAIKSLSLIIGLHLDHDQESCNRLIDSFLDITGRTCTTLNILFTRHGQVNDRTYELLTERAQLLRELSLGAPRVRMTDGGLLRLRSLRDLSVVAIPDSNFSARALQAIIRGMASLREIHIPFAITKSVLQVLCERALGRKEVIHQIFFTPAQWWENERREDTERDSLNMDIAQRIIDNMKASPFVTARHWKDSKFRPSNMGN